MRKIMYIVNPISGSGKGKALISEIDHYMKLANLDYSIKISNREGNIRTLVAQYSKEDYTDIIVVGGDGSVNEAINGIVDFSKIRFGIIPSGTGNDYARQLYKEVSVVHYLETIVKGSYKTVDIGIVNGHKFINSCGIGIDSSILKESENYKKYVKGPRAYLLSTLKNIFTYRAQKVNMVIDEVKLSREILLVVISKGKYFGGGMMIASEANLSNGAFEICIVNKIMPLKLMLLFPSIFSGRHIQIRKVVEIYSGKRIYIEGFDQVIDIQADGNLVSVTPGEIGIQELKLDIITSFAE